MNRARWIMHVALAIALFGAAPARIAASASARDDVGNLNRAIALLIKEAKKAKEDGALPRQETTFGAEFLTDNPEPIPPALVWRKISRPINKDPLIDAYVRWQLTGFKPEVPNVADLDDEAFLKVLDELPALLRNPRSEPAALGFVNQALGRESVTDAEAVRLREMNETLVADSSRINNLNRPGLQLRDWLEEACESDVHRAHLVRLERLRALVAAGWNSEGFKRRIAGALEATKRESSFTPEQRELVAGVARRLIGLRTAIITRTGAAEGNIPEAEFDEAAVYDFEVNDWIRTLQGRS